MLFRSDRKSTRLNSSHTLISYAVFCLKKKRDLLAHLQQPRLAARKALAVKHRVRRVSSANRRRPRLAAGKDLAADQRLRFFFLMIGRPPRSPLFPTRRSSD